MSPLITSDGFPRNSYHVFAKCSGCCFCYWHKFLGKYYGLCAKGNHNRLVEYGGELPEYGCTDYVDATQRQYGNCPLCDEGGCRA